MIATYVPPVVTPVSRDLAVKVFLWAMPGTLESAALALAHSALETGRWKYCHNSNVGNIKAGETYEGNYTNFRCNEVINDKVVWFDPPHPQTRFRAYPNFYAGTEDYVYTLELRFKRAWEVLTDEADAESFVNALKKQGYFTADAGPYLVAVASLQREFIRVIHDERDVPETDFDPELARLLSYADFLQVESGREMWDEDTTPGSV